MMKALTSFIIITLFLTSNSFAELDQKTLKKSATNSQDLAKKATKFLKQYGKSSVEENQADVPVKSILTNPENDATSTDQTISSKNDTTSTTQEKNNNIRVKNSSNIEVNSKSINKKSVKVKNSLKTTSKTFKPIKAKSSSTTKKHSDDDWLSSIFRKIYVRADYGIGKPQKISNVHFKQSPMYGAGIGYRFNQMVRADINFRHRTLKRKRSILIDKINSDAVFLDAYLNLMDENNYVIPFIVAGIGYTQNKPKDISFSGVSNGDTISLTTKGNKTKGFAWNAGIGASLTLFKNCNFELTYKYIDIGRVKWYSEFTTNGDTVQSSSNDKGNIHEVSAGVVINFG
ncbi:MAG: porin family protein [Rickettsiales bacterium]|nr:porin family protein [Rickettsiales bacterium]